jgi:acetyl/propionyl-CoA carboxylase alpha subunit
MFKKVLVANRGEIATRVVRACRDMGLWVVALYDRTDRDSLHVRLANECVQLKSDLSYLDQQEIVQIARQTGAEAIHPGYGFLAEQANFIKACEEAGLVFIGPPSNVVSAVQNKIDVLKRVNAAGFATQVHSADFFGEDDLAALRAEADRIGYPLVVKSCHGGRGRGARMVMKRESLEGLAREAQAEAQVFYSDTRVYLERAVLPSNLVAVQVLGDRHGNLIHLGERDGSLRLGNQKIVEETPAPCLTQAQQEQLWKMAIEIARLFDYRNVGSVEFRLDQAGRVYFTEIKARIQIDHPVIEMVTRVDLVREQMRLAAGEPLTLKQEDIRPQGWAMQCRINAQDTLNNFLPSPGFLRRFRLPGGPNIRVDTYAYSGCHVPVRFDPILAKLVVWGADRDECVNRMRVALESFIIRGIQTNLPLLQRILNEPDFIRGKYATDFLERGGVEKPAPETDLRDLAVAAAVAYVGRNLMFRPSTPDRLYSGWHRSSRQLPE